LPLALVLTEPTPAAAQPHTCGPGTVPEFGRWFLPSTPNISKVDRTETIEAPDQGLGVSGLKLQITVEPGASRDWNLVIRDSDFRVLASMGPRDFAADVPSSRWTNIFKASQVILDLVAPTTTDVRISVTEGIAFPANSKGRLFSIVNPAHPWQELYSENHYTVAKRAGDSVGMLIGSYSAASGAASWCCSGVMISPDILLTNWHCGGSTDIQMNDAEYWSNDVCSNTIVDVNWAKGATSHKYGCVDVLAKDKTLDFAAIRVGPVLGTDAAVGEPVHARLSSAPLKSGAELFIVHHSQCMEKLVSKNCEVKSDSYPSWWLDPKLPETQRQESEFTHNCNTETGASGAPVFDENGLVIGLHHLGAQASDLTCSVAEGENKAIKMTKIVDFLYQQKRSLYTEVGIPSTLEPKR
jgi:trypsin-like peptidase